MPRKPDDKTAAYLTKKEFTILKNLFGYLLELKFSDDPNVLKRDNQYYTRICELTGYSFKTVRNWFLPSGIPKMSEYNLQYFRDKFAAIQEEFGTEQQEAKESFRKLFTDWVTPICIRMKWELPDEFGSEKKGSTRNTLAQYTETLLPLTNIDGELHVSEPDLMKFLELVDKYYRTNLRIPGSEQNSFIGWKAKILNRNNSEQLKTTKNTLDTMIKYLKKSWWCLMEKSTDVLIKRNVTFDLKDYIGEEQANRVFNVSVKGDGTAYIGAAFGSKSDRKWEYSYLEYDYKEKLFQVSLTGLSKDEFGKGSYYSFYLDDEDNFPDFLEGGVIHLNGADLTFKFERAVFYKITNLFKREKHLTYQEYALDSHKLSENVRLALNSDPLLHSYNSRNLMDKCMVLAMQQSMFKRFDALNPSRWEKPSETNSDTGSPKLA